MVTSECNGVPPGGEVETNDDVRITAWLSCEREVERVALLRNGEMLEWHDVGEKEATVELRDTPEEPGDYWYSVTAEAPSPFRFEPVLCHASPFFVTRRPQKWKGKQ